MRKNRETEDRVQGNEALPDELGDDPREVGSDSAGQSGDAQRLSTIADANEESVEELAETDQAFEAAAVEGVEDAADHPERPVHTHQEYGRPDDLPPARISDRKKSVLRPANTAIAGSIRFLPAIVRAWLYASRTIFSLCGLERPAPDAVPQYVREPVLLRPPLREMV